MVSLINPSIGIVLTSSTALLTSIATLIKNEYISKLKNRYTKLRDWMKVNTLLDRKTQNQPMVDKIINQKESEELEKIYNHYIDKREKTMSGNKFEVEDVFGDVINKDNNNQDQII